MSKNDTVRRFSLAEALDLHKRNVREANRRVMAARAALEAATYEHETAVQSEARFKEFIKEHLND